MMKSCFILLMIAIACAAQPSTARIEQQHAQDLERNPSGVTLTFATADGGSRYHLSDKIKFKLLFTSTKTHLYTAEQSNGNAAAISDAFVIQAPDVPEPINSRKESAIILGGVCCDRSRHYIGQKPISAYSGFSFEWIRRLNYDFLHPSDPGPPAQLPPGDYAIYIQTRRVFRGWPKSQREMFHSASNFVVTSSNILHITILPDVSADGAKP